MKAVPFFEHGSIDVLKYQDFPDPVAGSKDVLIDVEYCGLNHLDIWARMNIAGKKIKLPHICGCDIVGTANGERVMVYPGVSCHACEYCKSGRENFCSAFAIIGGLSDFNGGYAEKVAVPISNVVKLPDSMKSELAVTLAVSYLTAWNMLKTTGAKKGVTVLVYGASGGIGMATVQLARALGCAVISTASGKEKSDFAKKVGADQVIDRTKEDIAGEVMKATGSGADIVIDHVGAATWATSIASLKQGGRMAVCGMTSGNDAVVPVRTFFSKQVVMTGFVLGTKVQLIALLDFVEQEGIKPVIDSQFPLQEAKKAQQKMESGGHAGKILLKI